MSTSYSNAEDLTDLSHEDQVHLKTLMREFGNDQSLCHLPYADQVVAWDLSTLIREFGVISSNYKYLIDKKNVDEATEMVLILLLLGDELKSRMS